MVLVIIDGAQGIVDVLKMKLYKFSSDKGKPEKSDIPDSEKEKADQLHNALVEKGAENKLKPPYPLIGYVILYI